MELAKVFQSLGIALGLGLLVGLQRERTDARLAGFRTFPLVTVFGAICALLAQAHGGWILGLGLVGLAGILVVGNLPPPKTAGETGGITTEVAILVMFGIGAYLIVGHAVVAIVVGGVVSVLLHLKPEMHALAARIGDRDFKAMMQFALISLVILPVLPNEYYGPYRVLNPFKIWLMVVLIVGISLGGYVVYKWVGAKAGALLGGVLGGLISSTATTVSVARRARATPETQGLAWLMILVASAIVFVRVLVLVGATAPGFLRRAAVPMGGMFIVLVVMSLAVFFLQRNPPKQIVKQENPSELKPAILFAALYAGVLLAVAWARDYFGAGGLYAVAALSGLTDMDAITLSVTQLVNTAQVPPETGWRVILVASMSNLVFKAGVVAVLGGAQLFWRVAATFAVAGAAGALMLWFWK